MRRSTILIVSSLFWALAPAAAEAETIRHEGLVFSDRLGGFRLVSVSGAGTAADPFVIVEEVTGEDTAILTIEGWAESARTSGGYGGSGFVVRKVAINVSEVAWQAYELELREEVGLPSGYLDGLSFGQLMRESRPAASDLLPQVVVRDEPHDSMVFSGGTVPPGASVTFEFMVTDITPTPQIFLLQRLRLTVAQR